MMPKFSISVDWLSANNGPPEIRETSAFLTISFGKVLATRAEDEWSRSVRPSVRASAYPLALWFAASWWRLRWEPSKEKNTRENPAWRMAHELPAAGYGFIWPQLVFESDGENVDAICLPSTALVSEPIRYLESFRTSIPVTSFEQTLDQFISLVLSRLDAVGIRNTTLHNLWSELNEERASTEGSAHRRLEARLGFDPDEAPDSLLLQLQDYMPRVGPDAISEIAPACAGSNPAGTFDTIIDLADSAGVEGKIMAKHLHAMTNSAEYKAAEPWKRGRLLARHVRAQLGLGTDFLSDNTLSEVLGIQPDVLVSQDEPRKPLSLAVRNGKPDGVKFIFRRRPRTGRRFEAARLLGDGIVAPVEDRWLPATDAKTVRQKTQRAFAAEFLCPIDALVEFLQDDYSSDEAINEAGEHFGISTLAVSSHLANNGLIDPTEIPTYGF